MERQTASEGKTLDTRGDVQVVGGLIRASLTSGDGVKIEEG